METKNSCYTYFAIVGNFQPDTVSALLQLTPDETRSVGDVQKNGRPCDSAIWKISRCDTYHTDSSTQMRQTISVLLDKIDLLQKIRETYDVKFYLSVVPQIYVNDLAPCLAPALDIIDFCHATRTEIDIDLYLYNEN